MLLAKFKRESEMRLPNEHYARVGVLRRVR